MGKRVFVSHANKDKPITDVLVKELQRTSCKIIYTSLPSTNITTPSKDFIEKIYNQMQESSIIVFCLSSNFYESEVCLVEMGIGYALEKLQTTTLIPLIIDRRADYSKNLRGIYNSHTDAYWIGKQESVINLLRILDDSENYHLFDEICDNISKEFPSDILLYKPDEDEAQRPTEVKKESKKFEDKLASAEEEVKKLYYEIDTYIMSIGEEVETSIATSYRAYQRRKKNFVRADVTSCYLLLYLSLDKSEVEFDDLYMRDMKKKGHSGTGNLELSIDSPAVLEKSKALIRQAYEKTNKRTSRIAKQNKSNRIPVQKMNLNSD